MSAKTCKLETSKVETNMLDTCRVCMYKQLEMTYIFENNSDIIEKIHYCTGLQITKEDGLPPQICKYCMLDLATAYKFKSSCILAYDTYQNLLKNEIKTEPDLHYDDSDGFVDDNDYFKVKDEPVKLEVEAAEHNDHPIIPRKRPRGPYKKRVKPKGVKHKPKPKATYWCQSCKISFKNKAQKIEHEKSIHNITPDTETWICEHCGKLFTNKSSMCSHLYTHLPPKYSCEQCDYKATFKNDLAKHKLVHAGIKLFQCQMCAGRFRTASGLSQHIQRNHDMIPKKFQCELCEKSFFDRTKHTRHMDSHNNIKRFECEVCHSCFSRRCYWKKHRLEKHNIVMPRERPGRQRTGLMPGNTTGNTEQAVVT